MDILKAIDEMLDLLKARDIGRLVKKQITDKRGRKTTVYVRVGSMKKRTSRRPKAPKGHEEQAWKHFVEWAVRQKKWANDIMKEKGKYEKLPASSQKSVREFHTKPVSQLAKEYYASTKSQAEKGLPAAKTLWEKIGSSGGGEKKETGNKQYAAKVAKKLSTKKEKAA